MARLFLQRLALRAPALTGAVFCSVLAFSSCGKKRGPDWGQPVDAAPASAETPAKPQVRATTPAAPVNSSGLRFMAYNVENWLTMDRFVDGKSLKGSPKPDSEKQAVISIIVGSRPDVIGLCEIGTKADLEEIRTSLKTVGLDMPHSHYAGGSDPTRRLGLLSRHPIVATATIRESEYRLNGVTFGFNRGVLDASVNAKGRSFRFLGVHLKSKREVDNGDQEQMRINEARLLRRHVDSILAEKPDARLVVYGDFNDTRATRAFKTVTGSYNDPGYLTAIPCRDSRGHAWTHHWMPHDIYSRIDYVTVSRALRPEVDFRASHVVDDPQWDAASDHRPLIAIFR
jgi:endonuclease/exonuclease/phosphatase family metal-dependent hydrolase